MSSPRGTAIALVAWTCFVWLTRVRNAVGDDDLSTAGTAAALVLSLSFLVLGGLVLGTLRRLDARFRASVLALGAWTLLVWVVRGADIATSDHSAGFVVVHLALGAISIALAALAGRAAVRTRAGFSPAGRDR